MNFLCLILGHKLKVVKKISEGSRKLKCLRCCRFYGINNRVRIFIPWDFELEDNSK